MKADIQKPKVQKHDTRKHDTLVGHYFVDGTLVAGAKDAADATRIYEEAQNATDP